MNMSRVSEVTCIQFMRIPCFLYLLMRGGLQLLPDDQSVGESGMMDNINQRQLMVEHCSLFCVCVCVCVCTF